MPAVLVESFFLDNDKDNDIGDTIEEQRAFGVAYAKAILEYMGITYQEEKPKEEVKVESKQKLYRVQVGCFASKSNALAMKKKLNESGFDAIVVES